MSRAPTRPPLGSLKPPPPPPPPRRRQLCLWEDGCPVFIPQLIPPPACAGIDPARGGLTEEEHAYALEAFWIAGANIGKRAALDRRGRRGAAAGVEVIDLDAWPPGQRPPRARTADPTSSHRAADRAEASGVVRGGMRAALDLVAQNPGCSARELSQRGELSTHTLGRRLPDLHRRGLIDRHEADDGTDLRWTLRYPIASEPCRAASATEKPTPTRPDTPPATSSAGTAQPRQPVG